MNEEKPDNVSPAVGGRYAKYVLFVLVIVYIFNFVDRQILSILAEDIKADLGISDAEIGFLYGTVFAVFYAVFGIPLGRLADSWVRTSLISVGLLFWSLMTALSGTARSFSSLATYRIGVGIGEASASPAAFSLLSDYFSPKMRATALAIYSSGVYIGSGIGIFIGGVILDGWANLYPDTSLAPWQLKGWHIAFFAVGIPGILMSVWVATLKEPQRGMSEGIVTPKREHPFRESWSELASLLPVFNLVKLVRNGGGRRGVIVNLVGLAVVASIGCTLYQLTNNLARWTALSIGVYAAFCWAQNLAYADPVAFHMIFRSKTIMFAVIGFPSTAFITYGIGFWGPPFFQRVHEVSASEAGMVLGLSAAVGGWFGVTIGGVLTDRLRLVHIRAKFYVGMASVVLSVPLGIGLLTSTELLHAYIFNFLFALTSPMWIGPAASTINDLVLPRMRAIASAFYLLMVTFIGLALGPYTIGFLSDSFVASGSSSAEALRSAMLWGLSMYLVAFAALFMASRFVASEEPSRLARARALGEDV